MSRMNLSGYVGHETIWLNVRYCVLFIVELGLGQGLDLVSVWLVSCYAHVLCDFRL